MTDPATEHIPTQAAPDDPATAPRPEPGAPATPETEAVSSGPAPQPRPAPETGPAGADTAPETAAPPGTTESGTDDRPGSVRPEADEPSEPETPPTGQPSPPVSLADEMADWTPPWRRDQPADTPPDEPVNSAETSDTATVDTAPPAAAPPAPRREPDPLPLSEDLAGTIEAILLVCEEPVSETILAQALGRPETEITDTLRRLAAEYTGDNRGFDLRRQAGGWRYYTRDSFAPYVERFILDGQQVRLTKAALETLAVVAYRQPVTRGRISAIRGVNCDGVIRTLTTRGLIEECGTEPDSGAHLYRTTSLFLEKLGINTVEELPALAPFLPEDITELGESGEN